MKTICFVLPTNKNISYLRRFFLNSSSVENIRGIKNYSLTLSVVSQSFSENELLACAGIECFSEVFYFYKQQESPAKMGHLRQIGVNASPDADFFVFVDDNMEIGDQNFIEDAANFLAASKIHSVVQIDGFFGATGGNGEAVDYRSAYVHCSRGLVLKNTLNGVVWTEDQFGIVGFEECAMLHNQILAGFLPAKIYRSNTKHHDKIVIAEANRKYSDDGGIHEFANCRPFFDWWQNAWGSAFVYTIDKYGDMRVTKQLPKKAKVLFEKIKPV